MISAVLRRFSFRSTRARYVLTVFTLRWSCSASSDTLAGRQQAHDLDLAIRRAAVRQLLLTVA